MSEPGEQTAEGDHLEYLRLAELVRITRRRARWRLAIGLTLALVFGGISLLSYLAAQ
jgi:hypothetical protein